MQQLGLASALPSFCTKCLVWSLRLEKEQPTANHHRAASVVCSSFTLARQLRASSFYPLDCFVPAGATGSRARKACAPICGETSTCVHKGKDEVRCATCDASYEKDLSSERCQEHDARNQEQTCLVECTPPLSHEEDNDGGDDDDDNLSSASCTHPYCSSSPFAALSWP